MTDEQQIELPKYVERAITSLTARSGDYAILSEEQWREVAEHIYGHEIIPNEEGKLFFPRGNLNMYGRGRKATLDALIHDSVVNHSGVYFDNPHYELLEMIYKARRLGLRLSRE